MADNITLNAGSGGASLAADDVSSVFYQMIKLAYGALDSATLVSASAGLPVQGQAAQDAAISGAPLAMGGRASAAAPSDMSADGDSVYLWTTLKGALNVADAGGNLSIDDGGNNISIDDGGNSITVDGSVTVTQGTGSNLHMVVDSGTVSTITNVVHVDDNSGALTVDNGGTFAVQAAQSGTWTVQPGNTANSTPWLVTNTPATSGGWSIANCTSGDTFTALTNSAQVIKGSAGQLGGWYIYNPNASVAYVNIYNIAAGSVTVGTSTPALNIAIPASSAANVEFTNGIAFGTAISASATTTGGGNTALGTALEANFLYK